MFRRFLVWLNGGELDSHTEPVGFLDRMDGVGIEDTWSVAPSEGYDWNWRGL